MPDVRFIELILDALAAYSNVRVEDAGLFGHSNGAGLVNRFLIESDDARVQRAVTDASQLNVFQFHDGSFFVGGDDNAFTVPRPTLTRRRLLAVQGGSDPVVPAGGGEGQPQAFGRKLPFLSDGESAFAFARAYGHSGAAHEVGEVDDRRVVSYLDGAVVSVTVAQSGHGSVRPEARRIVAFLAAVCAP
eukprot:3776953-Prymnesium_polylepis.1